MPKSNVITLTGHLFYSTQEVDDRNELLWERLDPVDEVSPEADGMKCTNARLRLDGKTIQFSQSSGPDGAMRVIVTYLPANVRFLDAWSERVQLDNHVYLTLRIRPTAPTVKFETQTKKPGPDPKSFPLALHVREFVDIRFRIFCSRVDPNFSKPRLFAYLAGVEDYQPSSIEESYVRQQITAIEAERQVALAKLQRIEGLPARCDIWRKKKVRVTLYQPPEAFNIDFGRVLRIGQYIYLSSEDTFTQELAKDYPSPYASEGIWVGCVIVAFEGDEPAQVLLEHEIWGHRDFWDNLEDPAIRIHIPAEDLTQTLQKTATERIRQDFTEISALEFETILRSGSAGCRTRPATLNTRQIFLDVLPEVDEDTPLDGILEPMRSESEEQLTDQQWKAITNIFRHSLSIVEGPPGTGKTRTLVAAVLSILEHTTHDVIICAPRHSNVEDILSQLGPAMNAAGRGDQLVRILSHPQSEVKMLLDNPEDVAESNPLLEGGSPKLPLNNNTPLVNESWYLHNRCEHEAVHLPPIRPASQSSGAPHVGDYLEGLKTIRETGHLTTRTSLENYQKYRDFLVGHILKKCRVWLMTTMATRLPYLLEGDHMRRSWVCVMDEAGALNDPEVAMPVMTLNPDRLVLFGDWRQQTGVWFSMIAQETWAKSVLQRLAEKGTTSTLLDVNFRTHERAAAHSNALFYGNRISFYHSTDNPRPFLRQLLACMPIQFRNLGGQIFKLSTYTHFIHVDNSMEAKDEFQSTGNPNEVLAIEGLVEGLLRKGVPLKDITIISGYRRQVELLKRMKSRNNWSLVDVRDGMGVKTIDGVQGHERSVVIFSLTKTSSRVGWLANQRRVNVATSRHLEALYVVGHWDYMSSYKVNTSRGTGSDYLRKFIEWMQEHHEGWVVRGGHAPFTPVEDQ